MQLYYSFSYLYLTVATESGSFNSSKAISQTIFTIAGQNGCYLIEEELLSDFFSQFGFVCNLCSKNNKHFVFLLISVGKIQIKNYFLITNDTIFVLQY